jgi:hypothetical protein
MNILGSNLSGNILEPEEYFQLPATSGGRGYRSVGSGEMEEEI